MQRIVSAVRDHSVTIRLAALWFALGVFTISYIALFGWIYQINSFAQQQRIILQNRNIEERMFGAIRDAESGQRGYLLDGDDDSLDQYTVAAKQVRTLVRTLKIYLVGNQAQYKTFTLLSDVVDKKLTELESTITLVKAGKRDEAIQVFSEGSGRRYTNQISDYMTVLRAQENNQQRNR